MHLGERAHHPCACPLLQDAPAACPQPCIDHHAAIPKECTDLLTAASASQALAPSGSAAGQTAAAVPGPCDYLEGQPRAPAAALRPSSSASAPAPAGLLAAAAAALAAWLAFT